MTDSKEDRVAYGMDMIVALTNLLEHDLSERLLTLMYFIPQLMAAEVTEGVPNPDDK